MKHNMDSLSKTLKVTVEDDLLSTNVETVSKELTEIFETPLISDSGWKKLEINLKAAKMVDSTGLNLLVSLAKKMKGQSRDISVLISSPNVQRTFMFTRLDQQVEVVMS